MKRWGQPVRFEDIVSKPKPLPAILQNLQPSLDHRLSVLISEMIPEVKVRTNEALSSRQHRSGQNHMPACRHASNNRDIHVRYINQYRIDRYDISELCIGSDIMLVSLPLLVLTLRMLSFVH